MIYQMNIKHILLLITQGIPKIIIQNSGQEAKLLSKPTNMCLSH